MFCQDDRGRILAPLDSVGASLHRLKGHLGLEAFIAHHATDPLEYLFLDSQDRGIKTASKACPRDTLPNHRATLLAINRFEILIHLSLFAAEPNRT